MGKRTEYHKQYYKQYRIDNKEKIKQYGKQYNIDNKKQIAENKKQYNIDNKETIVENRKQYRKNNDKQLTINRWKKYGIIDDDYDGLYDYFITQTNCWICDKVYNKDIKYDIRCLDHDHDITDDSNVRYICCSYCNRHIIK
tara:strand:+ start:42 stop:464 length:423 start_codon:yes stop_codon:yes gene_type:complete